MEEDKEQEFDDISSLKTWAASEDHKIEKSNNKMYIASIAAIIFAIVAYYFWKKSKQLKKKKSIEDF